MKHINTGECARGLEFESPEIFFFFFLFVSVYLIQIHSKDCHIGNCRCLARIDCGIQACVTIDHALRADRPLLRRDDKAQRIPKDAHGLAGNFCDFDLVLQDGRLFGFCRLKSKNIAVVAKIKTALVQIEVQAVNGIGKVLKFQLFGRLEQIGFLNASVIHKHSVAIVVEAPPQNEVALRIALACNLVQATFVVAFQVKDGNSPARQRVQLDTDNRARAQL